MLDYLKDILGIAGSGAQLFNMFRDDKNPALDAMMADNAERRRLRDMALNPNDPQFLNLVALEEESDRNNFAKSVTEAMKARSRASARGRVNTRPERQDEFLSAIQSRLTSGPQARKRVQGNLLSAAGTPNYGQAIGAYDQGNRWNTMRTDAAIRAGQMGAGNLLDMWSRSNPRMPDEWAGVTPGRKPQPGYADVDDRYKVWEST